MRLRSILPAALAAAVVAVLAVLLAGHSTTATPGQTAHTSAGAPGRPGAIAIANYAYSPPSLTVKPGATITLSNRDRTGHTVTADNGAFDTGTIQPGQSKRVTLTKAGTYLYHCSFHAFMTGTVTVRR